MARMVWLLSAMGWAFTSYAADLIDIYREARGSDAVYASARAAWSATQEKLPQGRAGLLPQASLSASSQYNDRSLSVRDGSATRIGQFNSNAVTLSLTQPLFRPQSYTQYEQAKTQLTQADAQFALAAQDLIVRVAQAYFDVLLAQDNVAFSRRRRRRLPSSWRRRKGTSKWHGHHHRPARCPGAL